MTSPTCGTPNSAPHCGWGRRRLGRRYWPRGCGSRRRAAAHRHRRLLLLALPAALVFIAVGAAVAGLALPILVRFHPYPRAIPPDISGLLVGLPLRAAAWFGLVCQVPLLLPLLVRLGLVGWRWLLAAWPLTLPLGLALAVVGGVIPALHPVPVLVMVGPIAVLYGLGLGLARLVG